MKSAAATVAASAANWVIERLDVLPPGPGEVLVHWRFAGLCISDEHMRNGGYQGHFPYVGGHEGAGVVEEVGAGVSRLRPGDHVAASWVPVCGRCRWCASGHSVMCVAGQATYSGRMLDGTFRFAKDATPYGSFAGVATFAQRAVIPEGACVLVDGSIPLDVVALASCGAVTGWGSAVRAGQVRPGETVVVFGVGGVGLNAIAAAAHAGALHVIAVDPLAHKRSLALTTGASVAVATADDARTAAADRNPMARGADLVIVATGVLTATVFHAAFEALGRRGRMVVASLTRGFDDVRMSGDSLVGDEKRIIGTVYGSVNPHADIPLVLELARAGHLPTRDLISRTYPLEAIAAGYAALAEGTDVRGLIDLDLAG